MSGRLLVIEDEDLLGRELVRHYADQGWEAERAATLAEARGRLAEADPLVVISDMSLPDGTALDLLEERRAQAAVSVSEWVFLTGFGTVPDSVKAIRLGAYDFLEKPCSLDRLDVVVAGARRSAEAQRALRDQAVRGNRRYPLDAFVGDSEGARRVRELLARLTGAPIGSLVISGETGAGKGLVARILHHGGPRRQAPLVEVNCAAIPGELLESELFGHEAGAFTGATARHRGLFEQAHRGTLFLDEIADMGPPLQARLLKALEDGRVRRVGGERETAVDVAVFAASNRDLPALVAAGEFRPDLYHRLAVVTVELPPLRERLEDLEALTWRFVEEFNARTGKRVKKIPEAVWRRMRAYAWPGNVRELRNVVERCILLADSEVFPEQWLQLPEGGAEPPAGGVGGRSQGTRGEAASRPVPEGSGHGVREAARAALDEAAGLGEVEAELIRTALARRDGNVAAAARDLGITRQTLRYRMRKHGIERGTEDTDTS
jgi:DNA-binding NtrC family response regulator